MEPDVVVLEAEGKHPRILTLHTFRQFQKK